MIIIVLLIIVAFFICFVIGNVFTDHKHQKNLSKRDQILEDQKKGLIK
ncbi:hypothetical protein SDC9_61902 [bioreactor metagenome]|uniref:Uncharacterized protein n=1 Tax=bioreactor metagenome TaxID=1076179 RepID=A0A644XID0_9ZZZZ